MSEAMLNSEVSYRRDVEVFCVPKLLIRRRCCCVTGAEAVAFTDRHQVVPEYWTKQVPSSKLVVVVVF